VIEKFLPVDFSSTTADSAMTSVKELSHSGIDGIATPSGGHEEEIA
jgi:hypothetical protein